MTREVRPADRRAAGGGEGPPPAPSIERRVRLYPFQRVGVPLLLAVPLLGLLKAFGPTQRVAEADAAGVHVLVEHPAVTRFGRLEVLRIAVQNRGPATLDSAVLLLDSSYMAAYRDVSVIPAPQTELMVRLPQLPAGATHTIRIDARAHAYLRTRGEFTLRGGNGAALHVPVSTFILP